MRWPSHKRTQMAWYTLTDKWIIAQKLGIPKIQFIDQTKLKKKEKESMNIRVLRSGDKIPAGGDKVWVRYWRKDHCPNWESISYTVTKTRHYYWFQQVLAGRSLIQLSAERLCELVLLSLAGVYSSCEPISLYPYSSELRSGSTAERSLSPGRLLCTEGCGVFWFPGTNGGSKTSLPAAPLI